MFNLQDTPLIAFLLFVHTGAFVSLRFGSWLGKTVGWRLRRRYEFRRYFKEKLKDMNTLEREVFLSKDTERNRAEITRLEREIEEESDA